MNQPTDQRIHQLTNESTNSVRSLPLPPIDQTRLLRKRPRWRACCCCYCDTITRKGKQRTDTYGKYGRSVARSETISTFMATSNLSLEGERYSHMPSHMSIICKRKAPYQHVHVRRKCIPCLQPVDQTHLLRHMTTLASKRSRAF